ncbi:hypothetical protein [Streptomyces sp. NBC_01435]|uniref:hypothetical protein n=1 Tax=Streptomyces sp. NBC_01435 TaxID=2903865 RepID=UPI002E35D9AB|nr:hypothetical protein [Streptomyces sp. NBC_01435]
MPNSKTGELFEHLIFMDVGPCNSSSDCGQRRRSFSRYSARSSAAVPEISIGAGAGRCGLEGVTSSRRPEKVVRVMMCEPVCGVSVSGLGQRELVGAA